MDIKYLLFLLFQAIFVQVISSNVITEDEDNFLEVEAFDGEKYEKVRLGFEDVDDETDTDEEFIEEDTLGGRQKRAKKVPPPHVTMEEINTDNAKKARKGKLNVVDREDYYYFTSDGFEQGEDFKVPTPKQKWKFEVKDKKCTGGFHIRCSIVEIFKSKTCSHARLGLFTGKNLKKGKRFCRLGKGFYKRTDKRTFVTFVSTKKAKPGKGFICTVRAAVPVCGTAGDDVLDPPKNISRCSEIAPKYKEFVECEYCNDKMVLTIQLCDACCMNIFAAYYFDVSVFVVIKKPRSNYVDIEYLFFQNYEHINGLILPENSYSEMDWDIGDVKLSVYAVNGKKSDRCYYHPCDAPAPDVCQPPSYLVGVVQRADYEEERQERQKHFSSMKANLTSDVLRRIEKRDKKIRSNLNSIREIYMSGFETCFDTDGRTLDNVEYLCQNSVGCSFFNDEHFTNLISLKQLYFYECSNYDFENYTVAFESDQLECVELDFPCTDYMYSESHTFDFLNLPTVGSCTPETIVNVTIHYDIDEMDDCVFYPLLTKYHCLIIYLTTPIICDCGVSWLITAPAPVIGQVQAVCKGTGELVTDFLYQNPNYFIDNCANYSPNCGPYIK